MILRSELTRLQQHLSGDEATTCQDMLDTIDAIFADEAIAIGPDQDPGLIQKMTDDSTALYQLCQRIINNGPSGPSATSDSTSGV
jgi:hypothetical protein